MKKSDSSNGYTTTLFNFIIDLLLRVVSALGYQPQRMMTANGLIDETLENPLSERSQCFSGHSAIMPTICIEDFQNNLTNSIIKVMMMPVVVPFRVTKYFVMLPYKWIISMIDKFLILFLKKLNLSKGEARVCVTKIASNQVVNLRNIFLCLLLLLVILSFSLTISTSIYTAFYLYLIPSQG
jgi:hypothetical protein